VPVPRRRSSVASATLPVSSRRGDGRHWWCDPPTVTRDFDDVLSLDRLDEWLSMSARTPAVRMVVDG
jgi:hypothetical protein